MGNLTKRQKIRDLQIELRVCAVQCLSGRESAWALSRLACVVLSLVSETLDLKEFCDSKKPHYTGE